LLSLELRFRESEIKLIPSGYRSTRHAGICQLKIIANILEAAAMIEAARSPAH
jgi:hypothetical protein